MKANINSRQQNQPGGDHSQLTGVSAQAFKAKASTKREVYRLLTVDGGFFLPDYDVCTIYHIKDLMRSKVIRIKADLVQHCEVPYYEGLSIKDMLKWAKGRGEGNIMKYLPIEERERDKLPRQYICDLIGAVCGRKAFLTWVSTRCDTRNNKYQQEEDVILMDPEIAAIYEASNNVSGKCPNIQFPLHRQACQHGLTW